MTVGDRIRKRRQELGLTQEELAERLGYKGRTSVCVVETGGDNVTTTKVQKFASALGVSPSYLMGWEDIEIHPSEDEQRRRAEELYLLYSKASPEVQKAVETILKSSQ